MGKRLTQETFLEKAHQIHGDRYDYSLVNYEAFNVKIQIICKEHGVFEMFPAPHIQGQGCKICSNKQSSERQTSNKDVFINKAKEIHGERFDYSKIDYIKSNLRVCIICPIHGEFWQTPSNHLYNAGCKQCRYEVLSKKFSRTEEEFFRLAKHTHGNKYDYSKTVFVKHNEKVIITCPIHGDFDQTPICHEKMGCRFCGYEISTAQKIMPIEAFIKKANEIHNNFYIYNDISYKTILNKIIVKCPLHGDFTIIGSEHLSGSGCPHCGMIRRTVSYRRENHNLADKIPHNFYCIRLYSEDEDFYKVGIAQNVEIRSNNMSDYYKTEILFQYKAYLRECVTFEQKLLSEFKKYKYVPKVKFGGWTECLSLNPIDNYFYHYLNLNKDEETEGAFYK